MEDLGTSPQKSVDAEYMQFIAENLLAYIVIFQQLLPRFIRIDLASPKMSLMLYRLTKVRQLCNFTIDFSIVVVLCENNFNLLQLLPDGRHIFTRLLAQSHLKNLFIYSLTSFLALITQCFVSILRQKTQKYYIIT